MKTEPVDLIGIVSPGGVKGGSSRGWMTHTAFAHHLDAMIADLRTRGRIDGVFLNLHGALAVEGVEHPEAEIARRMREVIGPSVPMVAEFDLHGNEGPEFLRYANASFVYKYYPHYDTKYQAVRAAQALLDMMRGVYKATSATRRVPILIPTVLMDTGRSPFAEIAQRALIWEASYPGLYVNYFLGFPYSDVKDAGMTVETIANGDPALAQRAPNDIACRLWNSRWRMLDQTFPKPPQAVSNALADIASRKGPVVLADYSDRAGDATFILAELIRQRAHHLFYATLRDESVVRELQRRGAKVGDAFSGDIGGKVSEASGSPIHVAGVIGNIGNVDGGTAGIPYYIIRFDGDNEVVITGELVQVWLPNQMKQLPIPRDPATIFVVKSRVHFRQVFEDTGLARSIYVVDAPQPFLGTVHLDALPYRNLRLQDYFPFSQARAIFDLTTAERRALEARDHATSAYCQAAAAHE